MSSWSFTGLITSTFLAARTRAPLWLTHHQRLQGCKYKAAGPLSQSQWGKDLHKSNSLLLCKIKRRSKQKRVTKVVLACHPLSLTLTIFQLRCLLEISAPTDWIIPCVLWVNFISFNKSRRIMSQRQKHNQNSEHLLKCQQGGIFLQILVGHSQSRSRYF